MKKKNVFVPKMVCIVVLVVENGEFQRFEGVCIASDVYLSV